MSEQYKFSACSNDWSASFSPYRVAMTMATPSVEILCNSVVLIVVLVAPCHGSSPFARTALMANSLTRSFATWFMIENSSDCTSYKLRSFLHLGIIVIWVVSGMLLTLEALMGPLPVLNSRGGVRSFDFHSTLLSFQNLLKSIHRPLHDWIRSWRSNLYVDLDRVIASIKITSVLSVPFSVCQNLVCLHFKYVCRILDFGLRRILWMKWLIRRLHHTKMQLSYAYGHGRERGAKSEQTN